MNLSTALIRLAQVTALGAIAYLSRKGLTHPRLIRFLKTLPALKLIPNKIARILDICEEWVFWTAAFLIPAAVVGSQGLALITIELVAIKAGCEIALFLQKGLGELLVRYAKNEEARERLETLIPAIVTVTKYATIGIAVTLAMYVVGIDPSPLLAGMGLVTLIIGIGAKEAIGDLIAGLFILFEGHYHLGDRIQIEGKSGIVARFSLKTTTIRTDQKDFYIFRNGNFPSFSIPYRSGENNIFVSYCRRDNQPAPGFSTGLIDTLVISLRKAGHNPWVDFEDIPPGSDWESEIIKGIRGAEIIIFALSDEFLKSTECQKEVAHVKARREEKVILPIVVGGISDYGQFPDYIAQLNYIFFDQPEMFVGRFRELMRAISDAYNRDI